MQIWHYFKYRSRRVNQAMVAGGNRELRRPVGLLVFLCLLCPQGLWAQSAVSTASITAVCQPPAVERDGAVLLPLTFLRESLGVSVSVSNGVQCLRYYGRTAEFQAGQSKAAENERPVTLKTAPVEVDGQTYVPLDLATEAFGLKVDIVERYADRTILQISGRSGSILGVRHSVAPDKVRVVIDLDAPTLFNVNRFLRAVSVDLAAVPSSQSPLPDMLRVGDALVAQVEFISGAPGRTFVAVPYRYRAPIQVFTLTDPYRLVFDCEKIFQEGQEQRLTTGLVYRTIRRGTSDGPLMVHVVEVDWHNPQLEVDVAPAGDTVMSRMPVSAIAAYEGAIVAINGGYFASSGAALGAMVRNREWVRLPSRGRSALGITADRKIVMDNLRAVGELRLNQTQSVTVHDLNASREADRVIVYTPRWGRSVPLAANDLALSVSGGQVTGVDGGMGGLVSIPRDGFVVVATGAARDAFAHVAPGQTVELHFRTQPDLPNLLHALGGGPRLLKDGREFVTAEVEQFNTPPFQNDPVKGRAPRTAVGVTADGKLLLVVIDGRQPLYSIGLTLWETARLLRELGAVDALNLDGGGSSTLVVRNRVVNAPSDGRERSVANALVVRVKNSDRVTR